jgi:hypothetical protein
MSGGHSVGGPHRWRARRRGRRPKPRRIGHAFPEPVAYIPTTARGPLHGAVCLNADELEALRLVYYEELTQEEAASRMGVSRGTLWRLLVSGRKKLVGAIVGRRPILVQPPEEACIEGGPLA